MDVHPVNHQAGGIKNESLPFTVRLVRNAQDLHKAVSIRHSAYARHLPDFAESLRTPETTDLKAGVAIFLAASKADGAPLGTMRIQTNAYMPLALEHSLALPTYLRSGSLAEATRLGVTQEKIGRSVKTALFKSYYQYCAQNTIQWMVIAGRSPLDRQYEKLMFKDVYPGGGYIPLHHANNVPHRVMTLEVAAVKSLWKAARHPLYAFFFETHHPDLETDRDGSIAGGSRAPLALE